MRVEVLSAPAHLLDQIAAFAETLRQNVATAHSQMANYHSLNPPTNYRFLNPSTLFANNLMLFIGLARRKPAESDSRLFGNRFT
ncbi:hypothetical protein J2801_001864 [Paraburkholderia phenoliruptrix]|uniref:hypothetical protein n=1 Tax=Paraburkholderia phenoliruptrix TaxID=252970 RepID=UPI002862EA57|nr:hypothetical protein [Paraburkholderia phenoliruptrix]MDR6419613.1 hypothetical protein [Paraburkholderia phenoliruptrix]